MGTKVANVSERLQKALPEVPFSVLMTEHNLKEKWDAITREVDEFVEQNATPPQNQRK